MSSGGGKPVTNTQAAVGVLAIAAVIALIVGLSYLVRLDTDVDADMALPERTSAVALENARDLGDPPCPSREDLARRGDPVSVSSAELIDCSDAFDGQRVAFAGEAVGVVLRRRQRAWLQLNDDPYALSLGPLPSHRVTVGGNAGMAVSVPLDAAVDVTVGDFRHWGTGLSVVGTFTVSHPDDPGSPAIHAETVMVVRQAQPVSHAVSTRRAVAAAIAAIVTLSLTVARWRQARA